MNSAPQTEAPTFAFAPLSILLLREKYNYQLQEQTLDEYFLFFP